MSQKGLGAAEEGGLTMYDTQLAAVAATAGYTKAHGRIQDPSCCAQLGQTPACKVPLAAARQHWRQAWAQQHAVIGARPGQQQL